MMIGELSFLESILESNLPILTLQETIKNALSQSHFPECPKLPFLVSLHSDLLLIGYAPPVGPC